MTEFPFSAIVGQDDIKLALLVAAVEPGIGGVLVFGDRGTGKSTTVRALASLLPPMQVIAGCPFNRDPSTEPSSCAPSCPSCHTGGDLDVKTIPVPVVDLPLGATEDRIVGALNLEHALSHGERKFEPGLLARANRGFLYIDEVNLLEDHLVDLLLDVAASGENILEREGLSVRHPARFVLIGSGNPEEGELRPQLLDRFGLSVEVKTPEDLDTRVTVVRRRDLYERAPGAFLEDWQAQEKEIRGQILSARARIADIEISDYILKCASSLCLSLGTDGLRGELTLVRAARAIAALDGTDELTTDHLRKIAPSSLRHRLRRNPLDDAGSSVRIERAMEQVLPR